MKHTYLCTILYYRGRPCSPSSSTPALWSSGHSTPLKKSWAGSPWGPAMRASVIKKLTCSVCVWDECWTVAILTSTNLLIYLADLLYLALEAFVGTKDGPQGSRFLFSPAVSSLSLGCSLPGSFSPFSHPSPFISFPFHFRPSFCSVFLFSFWPKPFFASFFFPSHLF